MAVTVIARWTARPGEELVVGRALAQLIEPTRAEPGNLAYHVHRDPDDPQTFIIYERYTDEHAFKAHGASDHFARLALEQAIPLLQQRERIHATDWPPDE